MIGFHPHRRRPGRRTKPGTKEFRIYLTPFQFWGILVLILLFPVSMNWKLFLKGKVTTGIVVPAQEIMQLYDGMYVLPTESLVKFMAGDTTHFARAPENVRFGPGREIKVLYNPSMPDKNVLLCFSGIFLDFELIWAGLALVLWLSFFLSFGKIRKKTPGNIIRNDRMKREDPKEEFPVLKE